MSQNLPPSSPALMADPTANLYTEYGILSTGLVIIFREIFKLVHSGFLVTTMKPVTKNLKIIDTTDTFIPN